MEVTFAHDHIFYEYNHEYYSSGGLSLEVLQRYTKVFENVTVLARQRSLENPNNNLTRSSGKNINFIKIENLNSLKNLKFYNDMNKVIRNQITKTDFLIARIPSTIGSLAIKWARKLNKPYLIEVVGCPWDAYRNHGNKLGKFLAPFAFLKQRREVFEANYSIYITKEFLQNRYPTKGISVICPNVMVNQPEESTLKNRISKIKNRDKHLTFGLIGSLDVEYKGHETVLRALNVIKNELPEFTVEFVGKGNPKRWIPLVNELGLEKNVKFLGTLPNGDRIFDWLDSVDIQLQPSFAEAQGRSIIEGMSRGCPIVASSVGGIVELIESKYLIDAGNYQDLAEKVLDIIDKNNMLNQAVVNFEKSKLFSKSKIDQIRTEFLINFRDSAS